MKPEFLAIAVGGIGWSIDTAILARTSFLWAAGCALVALLCFAYAWRIR